MLVDQAPAADRAQVALDLGAEHVLERLAQVARDQVQGLLEDRAALDHVERLEILEAALEPLDQRALARADRAHQVEDLPRLLAAHRGGVEVAHDLLERALHAEELVGEEVVDLDGLVAEHALGARVGLQVELGHARAGHHVVHAAVGEVGQLRPLLHELEILEEGTLPFELLSLSAILLDDGSEVDRVTRHTDKPRWLA